MTKDNHKLGQFDLTGGCCRAISNRSALLGSHLCSAPPCSQLCLVPVWQAAVLVTVWKSAVPGPLMPSPQLGAGTRVSRMLPGPPSTVPGQTPPAWPSPAGIPPAPRGTPQIEVSFEIDANGEAARVSFHGGPVG